MHWEIDPTGARIAQLATDLTARIDALDPESDTPVYSDFTFSIAVADWTLANGVYTARVNNTVLLTENAGIQVFYDASLRTGLVGDIFADKYTGYVIFTTTLQPVGPISGIIRVLDSVSGMLSVAKGGTGAATPKKARENLNTPIRDIPVDFGTVSSLPQTIYDADITANMVAFDAVFGNPAAVPGGIDVTFAAGSVTISGTMVSGQETTIKFLCHEKRTAVEGTESGSAEPRVNEFVHVGAQTLTADQQAQIRTNLGAASASEIVSNTIIVTDFNDVITSGTYQARASGTAINVPNPLVPGRWYNLSVFVNAEGEITQLAYNTTYGLTYIRGRNSGGSWTSWQELALNSKIATKHVLDFITIDTSVATLDAASHCYVAGNVVFLVLDFTSKNTGITVIGSLSSEIKPLKTFFTGCFDYTDRSKISPVAVLSNGNVQIYNAENNHEYFLAITYVIE